MMRAKLVGAAVILIGAVWFAAVAYEQYWGLIPVGLALAWGLGYMMGRGVRHPRQASDIDALRAIYHSKLRANGHSAASGVRLNQRLERVFVGVVLALVLASILGFVVANSTVWLGLPASMVGTALRTAVILMFVAGGIIIAYTLVCLVWTAYYAIKLVQLNTMARRAGL